MAVAPIMLGVQLAGMGINALGQYKQGQAAKSAAQMNSEIIMMQASEEERNSDLEFTRLLGTQRALYAKANVDITSGSPLLIQAETAMKQAEQEKNIKKSAKAKALMSQFQGASAASAATMGAFGSLISGIGQFGLDMWKTRKVNNAPNT